MATPTPVLAQPAKPAVPAEKTLLKTAALTQAVFAAPGAITLAAMLSGDHPSNANCSFYATVFTAVDGSNAISTAMGAPVVLSGSLPGLVGPVQVNLQPGKYRVDFSVKDEASSACKGATTANFEVKRVAISVGIPEAPTPKPGASPAAATPAPGQVPAQALVFTPVPPPPAPPPMQKATLKHAELNQAVFPAPGAITLGALLTADRSSSANCSFYATVFTATDGANGISSAVGSPTVLSGSLPGLVGPVQVNLQPGKYRVDYSVKDEAASACKGTTSANFEVKRASISFAQAAPVAHIVNAYTEIGADKLLKVSVLANGGTACEKLTLDIDGKKRDLDNVKFPLDAYVIYPLDRIYPTTSGQHTFTVTGNSANCKGSATRVFNLNIADNIINVFTELAADKTLKLSVLVNAPAICDKLTLDIDGKKKELLNIQLPLDGFLVPTDDTMYPKYGGKHTLTVTGGSAHCKGSKTSSFATVGAAAPPAIGSLSIGTFSNFAFTNVDTGGTLYLAGRPLQMDIFGSGSCQLDVNVSHKKTGASWTRRTTATFPSGKPYHYVGPSNMPPFGHFVSSHFLPLGTDNLDKEIDNEASYVVTVTPVVEANSICTGQGRLADYRTHCRGAEGCYPSGSSSAPSKTGYPTGLSVSGFTEGKADGKITLSGTGKGVCKIAFNVFKENNLEANVQNYAVIKVFSGQDSGAEKAVPLPFSVSNLGPLKAGKYSAIAFHYGNGQCDIGDDPKSPGQTGMGRVDFQVGNGIGDGNSGSGKGNGNGNGNGNGPGTPPGGSLPGTPKPATGNITNLQVPGGSFAEDDTQRLQVSGTGGCAMDLRVWNTAYGGNFDKTFDVKPMALAASPSLFNGTHFDTLAEGSWTASVTGKNSCTGSKTIDFKVTAKTSTAYVPGKPSLSLDQQPKSGGVFVKSKDSNILFKVSLPQKIKDVPNAGCCEVEYNYKNSFGGWTVMAGSPVSDPSWTNLIAKQYQFSSVSKPMSVSYFKVPGEGAMEWRMKVRAYKFKTQFDWSDWLEFKVDQN